MKITQALLDDLTEKAKVSPRLRANLDLRDSDIDTSQRMLNAIEPDSVVPIHRHQKTSETIAVIRGCIMAEIYDELDRRCVEAVEVKPCGQTMAVSVPAGVWHTVHSLESGTVILEMKNGMYEPIKPEDILEK